jgi:BlaI family transcriptional regulator, penicillinase repressor
MEVTFTDRELDIMGVLWDLGAATVAEVQERLADDLAYTTVLTILRTLEEKGHVDHTEEGRAYRYHPLVDREAAGASAVRRLVRKIFRGRPELLLTQLVSDRGLSDAEVERLRRLLEERPTRGRRGRGKGRR